MSTPPGLIGPDTSPGARASAGPPVPSRRPALVRPHDGRMLAGVAVGVAHHLCVPVRAVRFALVVATLMGGPGAVLYAWLWALVPDESSAAAAEAAEQTFRQSNRVPYTGGPILGTQIGGRPFPATPATAAGSVAPEGSVAPGVPEPARSAEPDRAAETATPATPATSAATETATNPETPSGPTTSATTAPPSGAEVPAVPTPPTWMASPAAETVAQGVTPDGDAQTSLIEPPNAPSEPTGVGQAADATQTARAAAVAAAAEKVEQEERSTRRTRLRADLFAGLCLLAALGVLIASWSGLDVQGGLVLPMLIVASGAVIAYAQFDEADRSRWFSPTGFTTRAATLRLLLGVVLVVLGIVLLVLQETDPLLLGKTLLATFAVLVGVAVVFAPWGLRFWRALDTERTGRVRESERADIAAHLHDSVLQTLSLIQRRSSDGAEVARLARAQERDLRGWLYGGADNDPTMISARVAALAAEAEDVHGAVIEVVTVGDRPVDERAISLLSALREAVANAARHAGGESVRVYVECMPDGIEAFVRDRGPGFDLAAVPEDRLGVRESIIGRMERHGGSARIRSEEGEGTEIRLLLPDDGAPEEEK